MELKEFILKTLNEVTEAMQESKANFAPREIVLRFDLDVADNEQRLDVIKGGAVTVCGVTFSRVVEDGEVASTTKTHHISYEVTILPPAKKPNWGAPLRSRPQRNI